MKAKRTTPIASSIAAHNRMRAAKPRDTDPEIALRKALLEVGLTFDIDVCLLVGSRRRADIVLRKDRIAIFIDGCFWHGCPLHGTWPKENAEFWRSKIEKNKERDRNTNVQLSDEGWKVIRVWEHEDPDDVAQRIASVLKI